MKNTRKIQEKWLSGIIESLPADMLNESGDPYKTTADNIRACGKNCNYTPIEVATHFLQGLGLLGFPWATEDHESLLKNWGYSDASAKRNAPKFWERSAALLLSVLEKHNEEIN